MPALMSSELVQVKHDHCSIAQCILPAAALQPVNSGQEQQGQKQRRETQQQEELQQEGTEVLALIDLLQPLLCNVS